MDQVTMTILMLVVCFGLMYFLTIRPQKKKEEELKQMMETLEVGDSVLTTSGFYGVVVDLVTTNIAVSQWRNQQSRQWKKRTHHHLKNKMNIWSKEKNLRQRIVSVFQILFLFLNVNSSDHQSNDLGQITVRVRFQFRYLVYSFHGSLILQLQEEYILSAIEMFGIFI